MADLPIRVERLVWIVRKGDLSDGLDLSPRIERLAREAQRISLREARPIGFPLFFDLRGRLIEPVVLFLHEHYVRRAHSKETLRTYAEILFDWLTWLEATDADWVNADVSDLVAYRGRMMREVSRRTGRPYCVSTINHRVRGILRFYEWAQRNRHVAESPLAILPSADATAKHQLRTYPNRSSTVAGSSFLVLRQFEEMPRPLSSSQAVELLAELTPPYDLMARWQLYTGVRIGELLALTISDVSGEVDEYKEIGLRRKGGKAGYILAPRSLLDETNNYMKAHRAAWKSRAVRRGNLVPLDKLFINLRGAPVSRSAYQRRIRLAGTACGFQATTHLLRATFACMVLARLERMASNGASINPLLIVKVLMGHSRIETTDRYLRAIATDGIDVELILGSE